MLVVEQCVLRVARCALLRCVLRVARCALCLVMRVVLNMVIVVVAIWLTGL